MRGQSFSGMNFGVDTENIKEYRDKNVCSQWHTVDQTFELCNVQIMNNPYGDHVIKGRVKGSLSHLAGIQDVYLKFWAANKPTYLTNFAGSGLPYPNEEVAFENTPNVGAVKVDQGEFTYHMQFPNSYYKHLGQTLVPPQVKFKFCDRTNKPISQTYSVKLGNPIPYRSLTWPKMRDWNKGPLFYLNKDLPIRNQEQILRDSAYPAVNQEAPNFWGTKPPV